MAIDLDAIPQVATAFQNADHREEGRLVNEAIAAVEQATTSDARLAAVKALEALAVHTQEHFAREEEAMQRTGFPPFAVHLAEHERVLSELRAIVERFRAGESAPVLQYLTHELPTWFVRHIQSMDHVTAEWLASKS